MPRVRTRWYDLVLRAAMVALLVGTVVTLSFRIGPDGERHPGGVSDRADQHHAHPASPRRRQADRGGDGQCGDRAGRLCLRLHRCCISPPSRSARRWRCRWRLRPRSAAICCCFSRASAPWRSDHGARTMFLTRPAAEDRDDREHRGGGLGGGRALGALHRLADRLAADGGRRRHDHPRLGASAGLHRAERGRQHGRQRRLRGLCAHLCRAGAAALAAGEPRRAPSWSGLPPPSPRGWWIGMRRRATLLNAVVYPMAIFAGSRFRAEGAVKRVTLTARDLAWRAGVVTLCVHRRHRRRPARSAPTSPVCSLSFRWRWDRSSSFCIRASAARRRRASPAMCTPR